VLFNSHEYLLIFLPATVLIYAAINRWVRAPHAARLWLIAASLFFYASSEPRFVLLLICSVLFNFSIGKVLCNREEDRKALRRSLLALAIALNVGLLGYFKYSNFMIANLNLLLHTRFTLHSTGLPLGISFITFIQIAYIVDCFRRPVKAGGVLDYGLFSTFFAYILSGPIVRYSEVVPQVKGTVRGINYRNLSLGLYLLSIGLFKKAVIADRFAEWATAGFDGTGQLNFLYAWVTSLCYTFQIYFDFSGYTDMALGAASMFNIKLPFNFSSPYKALDPQDFWRRWHITLGRFLREYVYIPLGGSRVTEARVCLNLMITFLICGLWHGAGWTFIVWGLLHGLALVIHRIWKKTNLHLPPVVAWLLTFNFVNAAWVFFRARTWDDAVRVLSGMCGFNGFVLPEGWARGLNVLRGTYVHFAPWKSIMAGNRDACVWIPIALVICLAFRNSNQMAEEFKSGWRSLFVIAAGSYAILSMFKMSEFLYFNF
jgi:alginate O-acetyltransferase complex protein AlgI